MTEPGEVRGVRVMKPYAEAHDHPVIGEVSEESSVRVRLRGRACRFGRSARRTRPSASVRPDDCRSPRPLPPVRRQPPHPHAKLTLR
jgi:hypothetical protein